MQNKTVQGRQIEFTDMIHHHQEIKISGWDRIRILINGKLRTYSKIYTKELCNVRGSEAEVFTYPIFNKKNKTVGLGSNDSIPNITQEVK